MSVTDRNPLEKDGAPPAHGGPLRQLLARDVRSRANLKEKILTLPRLNLNPWQLNDLEILLSGGYTPLGGFMTREEYESVVKDMRLPNGTLWPIPVILDLPGYRQFNEGDEVALCDEYGSPLAVLAVESVYVPDREHEARMVYGTTDIAHPGVSHLLLETNGVYIGGKVDGIGLPARYDFGELRHTPAETREFFRQRGWNKVIGFHTHTLMHRMHFELLRRAAKEYGADALIHPALGVARPGDLDYVTRIHTCRIIHEKYGKDFTHLAVIPLTMRMAGPREALWHAIIRKNYGCTHFIVGRDHAGPAKKGAEGAFYAPEAAANLLKEYEEESGITVVSSAELLYVVELGSFVPADEALYEQTGVVISEKEAHRLLLDGEPLPHWFTFPELLPVLRAWAKREAQRGFTVFFTGLPGSGKSTVANTLAAKLIERQHRPLTLLDGDIIREHLSRGLGFSTEDRKANIERVGFVAKEIVRHGGIAICALIAPYELARAKNRQMIERYGAYVEVYVGTPLEVCRERDPKQLYKKAANGLIDGLTGAGDIYEPPRNPEVTIDTSTESPEGCARKILAYLEKKGLIK
jgi:sulfate adenylyltransferase